MKSIIIKLVGPSCQGEETFYFRVIKEALPCVRICSWWVKPVRGRNYLFSHNTGALAACGHGPCGSLLSANPRTCLIRWLSFVDKVDPAAPREPTQWTMVSITKRTTWSRRRHSSGCPPGGEYEGSLVRLRCEAAVAGEELEVLVSRGMAWTADTSILHHVFW